MESAERLTEGRWPISTMEVGACNQLYLRDLNFKISLSHPDVLYHHRRYNEASTQFWKRSPN